MFLTPLATIYTSMCVNLLRGGVSTGIKRKIVEGFGDRSSYVCFGSDNSRNPERTGQRP
ncbi:unnamed protein product [Brassica oleracea var. botrytis]